MQKFILWFVLFFSFCTSFRLSAQNELDAFYPRNVETFGTYAVVFSNENKVPSSVQVKYKANGWSYVLAERDTLYNLLLTGVITQLYREPAQGVALNDTVRKTHFVNQVHQGLNMDFPFTGNGVIMGYVDTGLDVRHLDFRNSNGQTRVLRYWNQGQSVNFRTPAKYGYGRVYKNTDINSNFNIVGQINQSGHGTTVTGTGSGNGLANGRNKGVAPDCNIIIVRNVLTLPSWSLTVAQGVDYIFSVADSLGMPAVVNLSLGSYLGSHDATDPAALYIDSLLNQQEGRVVVCAAGNSGAWPAYHVQQQLSTDTNFVWMIPNPALTFGSPGVYFDLWADTADIQNMHFAFGADAPGPVYRGNTTYKQVNFANQTVQYDTIYGINNDIIGTVIYQGQVVGPNYNLQTIIYTDSLSYMMRFLATGAGKIDLWSSADASLNLSDFSQSIPDTTLYPEFANYMMPDTLQSIVSSWACSDKVITVGNIQNRKNYIDSQGNVYPPGGGTIPAGILSSNSSKGPSRKGSVKPEVVASGDMNLSACVLGLPHNPSSLDIGGLHIRNGGTSMASPVVAGIAALYLQKCPNSTWQDFKDDLTNGAFEDNFTGNNLPNYAYGYGKAHALNTLLETEFDPVVSGSLTLCSGETELEASGNNLVSMVWNNNANTLQITATQTGAYHGLAANNKGCKNYTDTVMVINDLIPPSGLAPADTWVSCIASIPNPDVNSLTNLSDNCGVDQVIHLNDSLHLDPCLEFVERTYRISDDYGNYTDVNQIISILQGTVPTNVDDNTSEDPIHACEGVFVDQNNCEAKIMTLDANGNALDYEDVQISVLNEFVNPLPNGVIDNASGYYEITDGVNTFRVSKKMVSIEAPGTFSNNGGVLVRLYYNNSEIDGIVNDLPDFGLVSSFGWFKSSHHDPDAVVGEMSPDSPLLASAEIIYPVNSGTEQGVDYVEFLVNSFSTFGYYSSTQLVPLPVTMVAFETTCQDDHVLVNWTTASELNASHYDLELSTDGFNWQTVEVVPAAGTTNQTTNYQAVVPKYASVQYYCLKQKDLNGDVEVFGPISSHCAMQQSWIVYPNPTSGSLFFNYQSAATRALLFEFFDLHGRVVMERSKELLVGQNNEMFDVSVLSSGVYMLQITGLENEVQRIKLVVQ